MNKYSETEIKILMQDKCTKAEAKKFLEQGTIILEESEIKEHFDDFLKEWLWGFEDTDDIAEETKAWKEWIFNDGFRQDCSKVEYKDVKYCIIYAL